MTTTAERDQAARRIRCPKCNAQPYTSCRAGTVRLTFLRQPHAERVRQALRDLAADTGEKR